MIDIHCHVIFGVDDGPDTLEESMDMLKEAIKQGITDMIATSHYWVKRFPYEINKLKSNYQLIQDNIKKENLPIKLHLGNEIYLNEKTYENLRNKKCLPLANSKYILIESNDLKNYYFFKKTIFDLGCNGYIPIIAHCERLVKNNDDYRKLLDLNDMGCYLQIDADFFIGSKKLLLKRWIIKQMKEGVISFVASDTHGVTYRPNNLLVAYKLLIKKIGKESADLIIIENPKCIINNSPII